MSNYEKKAKIFKAFCDPNRLMIIDILKDNEQCACKLLEQLNIGQPTLSHHMKILCDLEIVKYNKNGKWTHYYLNKEKLEEIKVLINDMI